MLALNRAYTESYKKGLFFGHAKVGEEKTVYLEELVNLVSIKELVNLVSIKLCTG